MIALRKVSLVTLRSDSPRRGNRLIDCPYVVDFEYEKETTFDMSCNMFTCWGNRTTTYHCILDISFKYV